MFKRLSELSRGPEDWFDSAFMLETFPYLVYLYHNFAKVPVQKLGCYSYHLFALAKLLHYVDIILMTLWAMWLSNKCESCIIAILAHLETIITFLL